MKSASGVSMCFDLAGQNFLTIHERVSFSHLLRDEHTFGCFPVAGHLVALASARMDEAKPRQACPLNQGGECNSALTPSLSA